MNFGNLGTAQYYSTMAQNNTNAQNLKVQELQNQQQEYQMGQMKMQAYQQQMAQQEQQQKFQASEMAKLASSLESGGTEQQQAAIWSKAKTDALKSGYVDLAKQYGEEEQSLLKTAQEKQKLQKQEGIDDKSSAYTAYETALLSSRPEDILASQVAAQKAGLPIPKFGDKSQEESQRKIYMANVEGVKAEQDQEERIRKDKTDEAERERSHKEEESRKRQKDAEIAVGREQNRIQRDRINNPDGNVFNTKKSEVVVSPTNEGIRYKRDNNGNVMRYTKNGNWVADNDPPSDLMKPTTQGQKESVDARKSAKIAQVEKPYAELKEKVNPALTQVINPDGTLKKEINGFESMELVRAAAAADGIKLKDTKAVKAYLKGIPGFLENDLNSAIDFVTPGSQMRSSPQTNKALAHYLALKLKSTRSAIDEQEKTAGIVKNGGDGKVPNHVKVNWND